MDLSNEADIKGSPDGTKSNEDSGQIPFKIFCTSWSFEFFNLQNTLFPKNVSYFCRLCS